MTKILLGSLELNRIYQRDCLEGMAMIPDKSVDLIVIDPPYNIGKDKRWDKWKTVDAYVEWMSAVFKECERVLKSNGSLYWFHNDLSQIRELMASLEECTHLQYKQFITWSKVHESFKNHSYVQQRLSNGTMRNYYGGFTEYCLYYTKNPFVEKLKTSRVSLGLSQNDVDVAIGRVEKKRPNTGTRLTGRWEEGSSFPSKDDFNKLRTLFGWSESYEEVNNLFNTTIVKDNLRGNSNVWLYPPAKNLGHITPKPVEMIENIIRHSSNEGDIILDCFMGSGTTAVAASRLNRYFIGFERETEYVKISNQRLEAAQDENAERKLTE